MTITELAKVDAIVTWLSEIKTTRDPARCSVYTTWSATWQRHRKWCWLLVALSIQSQTCICGCSVCEVFLGIVEWLLACGFSFLIRSMSMMMSSLKSMNRDCESRSAIRYSCYEQETMRVYVYDRDQTLKSLQNTALIIIIKALWVFSLQCLTLVKPWDAESYFLVSFSLSGSHNTDPAKPGFAAHFFFLYCRNPSSFGNIRQHLYTILPEIVDIVVIS